MKIAMEKVTLSMNLAIRLPNPSVKNVMGLASINQDVGHAME